MNWNNIDLKDGSYERDANLIDPLTFDTLLMEINCNVSDINAVTVAKQFNEDMERIIEDAKSVFNSNYENILKQAKKERAQK